MIDDRDLIERAIRSFPPQSGIVDRVFRRRARRRRNQRITAGVLSLALAAGATGGAMYAFRQTAGVPASPLQRWTDVTPAGFPGFVSGSLVTYGDAFVAAAADRPSIWISADGRSWEQHRIQDDGGRFSQIAVGGVGLVALRRERIWYSTNATTWARADVAQSASALHIEKLIAAGDQLFATSPHAGIVLRSRDGRAWEPIADTSAFDGPGGPVVSDVTAGGPGYVAVGSTEASGYRAAAAWTSVDGLTWRPVDDAHLAIPGESWIERIIPIHTGLAAYGWTDDGGGARYGGVVWTSVDGSSWHVQMQSVLFGAGFSDVAALGPRFVAVGNNSVIGNARLLPGFVWASAEGVTWNEVDTGDTFRPPGSSGVFMLQDVAVLGDMVLVSGFHDPSGAYGPDVHPRLWLADSITAGS